MLPSRPPLHASHVGYRTFLDEMQTRLARKVEIGRQRT